MNGADREVRSFFLAAGQKLPHPPGSIFLVLETFAGHFLPCVRSCPEASSLSSTKSKVSQS